MFKGLSPSADGGPRITRWRQMTTLSPPVCHTAEFIHWIPYVWNHELPASHNSRVCFLICSSLDLEFHTLFKFIIVLHTVLYVDVCLLTDSTNKTGLMRCQKPFLCDSKQTSGWVIVWGVWIWEGKWFLKGKYYWNQFLSKRICRPVSSVSVSSLFTLFIHGHSLS